jgi:hypothetical protein
LQMYAMQHPTQCIGYRQGNTGQLRNLLQSMEKIAFPKI